LLSSTTGKNRVWPCPTIEIPSTLNFGTTYVFFHSKQPKHIKGRWAAKRNAVLEDLLMNTWTEENDLKESVTPLTKIISTIIPSAKESQMCCKREISAEFIQHCRNRKHMKELMVRWCLDFQEISLKLMCKTKGTKGISAQKKKMTVCI
jgi:hypothetical protein